MSEWMNDLRFHVLVNSFQSCNVEKRMIMGGRGTSFTVPLER